MAKFQSLFINQLARTQLHLQLKWLIFYCTKAKNEFLFKQEHLKIMLRSFHIFKCEYLIPVSPLYCNLTLTPFVRQSIIEVW